MLSPESGGRNRFNPQYGRLFPCQYLAYPRQQICTPCAELGTNIQYLTGSAQSKTNSARTAELDVGLCGDRGYTVSKCLQKPDSDQFGLGSEYLQNVMLISPLRAKRGHPLLFQGRKRHLLVGFSESWLSFSKHFLRPMQALVGFSTFSTSKQEVCVVVLFHTACLFMPMVCYNKKRLHWPFCVVKRPTVCFNHVLIRCACFCSLRWCLYQATWRCDRWTAHLVLGDLLLIKISAWLNLSANKELNQGLFSIHAVNRLFAFTLTLLQFFLSTFYSFLVLILLFLVSSNMVHSHRKILARQPVNH